MQIIHLADYGGHPLHSFSRPPKSLLGDLLLFKVTHVIDFVTGFL